MNKDNLSLSCRAHRKSKTRVPMGSTASVEPKSKYGSLKVYTSRRPPPFPNLEPRRVGSKLGSVRNQLGLIISGAQPT